MYIPCAFVSTVLVYPNTGPCADRHVSQPHTFAHDLGQTGIISSCTLVSESACGSPMFQLSNILFRILFSHRRPLSPVGCTLVFLCDLHSANASCEQTQGPKAETTKEEMDANTATADYEIYAGNSNRRLAEEVARRLG